MYKIILLKKSIEQLNHFIHSILDNNLSLFEDSGIDDIVFIEKNYLEHSELLKKKILQEINKVGSSEIVGKMQTDTGTIFSVQVANFRMFVHYEEDSSSKTRFLESIEFFRK